MTKERTGLMSGSVYQSRQAWEWAHESIEAAESVSIPASDVTAILVVCNAEEWLPWQLRALENLDPQPGKIIAVNNGSTDGSAELLEQALAKGILTKVIPGKSGDSFGAAVKRALGDDEPEWIWLLHDDSAPKPKALEELLRVAAACKADLLYPKLLLPKRRNYPDQLFEVGRTVSSSGRIVTNVELGEIDQKQHDVVPTLGGSSAGMLVSGEVWRRLDGFAADIQLYRDGLEFGWRANQHGYTVLTCPTAALYHRQSGRMGWRESELAPNPIETDRLMALRLMVANGKAIDLRLKLMQWLRALGFLLGKLPALARSELVAWRKLTQDQEAVTRLSTRIPNDAKNVSDLLPSRFAGLRHFFDFVGASIVECFREFHSDYRRTSIDELTGGDYAGGYTKERTKLAPLLIAAGLLIVFTMLAGRSYLGAASLSGGGLMPAPTSLTEAWRNFLVPTPGVAGTSPIWLGLAALASTITLGNPGLLSVLFWLSAPLLALLAANKLLKRWFPSAWLRAALATTWATALFTLGFVGGGNVTGLVAGIVLPRLVNSFLNWIDSPSYGAERWRAPASFAGWLLVMSAVYPISWLIGLIGCGLWCLKHHDRILESIVAVGAPLVLLLGWMPILIRYPGRLLTGVDPNSGVDSLPGVLLIFGRINTTAPHLILTILFFVGLWIGAGIALWFANWRIRIIGLTIIASSYLIAGISSRFVVPVNGGTVRPDLSVWLLIVIATLIGLIAVAAHREPNLDQDTIIEQAKEDPRHLLLPGILSLTTMVWFAITGFGGLVHPHSELLPSYVLTAQNSVRATRTLMIVMDQNKASWSIVSKNQPSWGVAEHSPINPDHTLAQELTDIAVMIAQGPVPERFAARLNELGIGHIWLRGGSKTQIANISNAAGMTRISVDDRTQVWTAGGQSSVINLISGSAVSPLSTNNIKPGSNTRKLVLAEPADSRWQVWIGGVRAKAQPGDRPTFLVPEQGGKLEWQIASASWYALIQGLTLLILAVLAAPVLGGAPQARRSKEA